MNQIDMVLFNKSGIGFYIQRYFEKPTKWRTNRKSY